MGCTAGKEVFYSPETTSEKSVPNSDTSLSRSEQGAGHQELICSDIETHNGMRAPINITESSAEVNGVGAGSGRSRDLDEVMRKGRDDIRQTQEKLNNSLTTPIVDREVKVLESG